MLGTFGASHNIDVANLALLVLRCTLGAMILAHGINKFFGGGRLPGTARWFESIGMRPGLPNAIMAATTEVGSGVLLLAGLGTPVAAGALIALMTVAIVTVHRKNGFFVFRPGQGIEYCLVVALCSAVLAAMGPGRWSLDYAIGWHHSRLLGLVIALVLGLGGAGLQLAAVWRPGPAAE